MSDLAVWVEKAIFSDGTTVAFGQNDIVVMVGANNSGKSEALRNIDSKIQSNANRGPVITRVTLAKAGTLDDLKQWLERNSRKANYHNGDYQYVRGNGRVIASTLAHQWERNTAGIGDLSPFFCFRLSAEERLAAANPPNNINLTTDPLVHPIHYLQANDELEASVSRLYRRSFGDDLIVHRNAGSKVPLYCGKRPVVGAGQDRLSFSYVQALEQLSEVHTQGDGIRAFVGVLLHTLVMPHSMLLIDEPEAFLHPPQVRELAHIIARDLPTDRQIFIATHSGDFVRGIIDANQNRVRIIRLRRDGNVNHVCELSNARIRDLWSDPLLRYSNVLDGLFHEKTVVAEADADCRFYSAIKDSCDYASQPAPDVMFTHCGGKARLKTVIKALRGLGVPVRAICDFDILSDESPLREVYEELGGSWDTLKRDWQLARTEVLAKQPQLRAESVKQEIRRVLDGVTGSEFPKDAIRSIEAVVKKASAWALAKEVGRSYIPAGNATQAYERLDAALREKGCFVVPSGELESFDRTVGNHGPKWVNAVLEKDLKATAFDLARTFVGMVVA